MNTKITIKETSFNKFVLIKTIYLNPFNNDSYNIDLEKMQIDPFIIQIKIPISKFKFNNKSYYTYRSLNKDVRWEIGIISEKKELWRYWSEKNLVFKDLDYKRQNLKSKKEDLKDLDVENNKILWFILKSGYLEKFEKKEEMFKIISDILINYNKGYLELARRSLDFVNSNVCEKILFNKVENIESLLKSLFYSKNNFLKFLVGKKCDNFTDHFLKFNGEESTLMIFKSLFPNVKVLESSKEKYLVARGNSYFYEKSRKSDKRAL